jgi:hypothetical protein
MMSFKQFIRESYPPLYEDAIILPLKGFIETLSLLDAQKTDGEQFVEIREDVPEPGTFAFRLMVREEEEETE